MGPHPSESHGIDSCLHLLLELRRRVCRAGRLGAHTTCHRQPVCSAPPWRRSRCPTCLRCPSRSPLRTKPRPPRSQRPSSGWETLPAAHPPSGSSSWPMACCCASHSCCSSGASGTARPQRTTTAAQTRQASACSVSVSACAATAASTATRPATCCCAAPRCLPSSPASAARTAWKFASLRPERSPTSSARTRRRRRRL